MSDVSLVKVTYSLECRVQTRKKTSLCLAAYVYKLLHILPKIEFQTLSLLLCNTSPGIDFNISFALHAFHSQRWARSPPFGDLEDQDHIIQKM